MAEELRKEALLRVLSPLQTSEKTRTIRDDRKKKIQTVEILKDCGLTERSALGTFNVHVTIN